MKSLVMPHHFQKNLLILLPLGQLSPEKIPNLLEHWAKWAKVLGGSLWPISENFNKEQCEIIKKYADFYDSYIYLAPIPQSSIPWGHIYEKIQEMNFSYVLQVFEPLFPEELGLQLIWEYRNSNSVVGGAWNTQEFSFKRKLSLWVKSLLLARPINFLQTPFFLFHNEILKKILETKHPEHGLPNVSFFANLVGALVKEMEFLPFIPLVAKDPLPVLRGPLGPV